MVSLISQFMNITLPRDGVELGEPWRKLYLVARRLRRNLRMKSQESSCLQRKWHSVGLVFYCCVTNYHKLNGLKQHSCINLQSVGKKSGTA